jgi:hypothetical protein
VHSAWPQHGRAPRTPLERWLAHQVGVARVVRGVRPTRRDGTARGARIASLGSSPSPGSLPLALAASATEPAAEPPLQLVRSYQIPANDPSSERLLNWSWTYDSAISAASFAATDEQAQAQRLLDQLTALQHANGAIEFAFNTQTGQAEALVRSGTIATVGLAAAIYDQQFSSSRYLATETRAAAYLLSLQTSSGLIKGGPDVSWVSTQHNLLAYAFLSRLAAEEQSDGNPSEATHYWAEAAQIATAIETSLLVQEGANTHFLEGSGDEALALDTQALGAMFLQSRGQSELALRVLTYSQSTFGIIVSQIGISSEPATYNTTYTALGPFVGYEPYAGADAPEVLWFEGTAEMRSALAATGQSTSVLAASMTQWQAITQADSGAPLQASSAVTSIPYNVEYHVWPAAAAAAWTLIAESGVTLFPPLARYAAAIAADAPELWYRLKDTPGTTTATDSATTPHNGVYRGGVALGASGVTRTGETTTAVTLDGSSGYISNSYQWINPQTFTLEAWVKTTTTSGGLIVGFASTATGAAGNYDRQIYMANDGQIYFGVGANHTIDSPRDYNDGNWHLIDATFSPSTGMALYVDGALVASNSSITAAQVYNGYWRVGYDSLGGWAAHPTSNYLAATLDEIAVYPTALSAVRVAARYLAG